MIRRPPLAELRGAVVEFRPLQELFSQGSRCYPSHRLRAYQPPAAKATTATNASTAATA